MLQQPKPFLLHLAPGPETVPPTLQPPAQAFECLDGVGNVLFSAFFAKKRLSEKADQEMHSRLGGVMKDSGA
jgi:hypothetical protein